MEKTIFLVVFVIGIFLVISRVIRFNAKKDSELLNDFLQVLSLSFHEARWNILEEKANSNPLSNDEIASLMVSKLQKDTKNFLKELILNMRAFRGGGFRYYTADEQTNLFMAKAYNMSKEFILSEFTSSRKQREENLENLTQRFYDNLKTLIVKCLESGELKSQL